MNRGDSCSFGPLRSPGPDAARGCLDAQLPETRAMIEFVTFTRFTIIEYRIGSPSVALPDT